MDRTVFAVGDEKQSIYSFQGARPERLRQESQAYGLLAAQADRPFRQTDLDVSFRTTQTVLDFIDRLFDTPERAHAVVGPQGAWTRHVAHRAGDPGSVELWDLFEDPEVEEREAWDPVDQEPAASARKRLARALAEDIRRQVDDGIAVTDAKSRQPRACGYGDFLVLVRRRDALFEEILRGLKAAGVPVAGADRLKLSSHVVFDDFKALARFALFPEDDLGLAEVLRGPFIDLPDFKGADSLFQLAERTRRKGRLWRALQDRAGEHPAWSRAADWLRGLIQARGCDPFAFFSHALNQPDAQGLTGRARILRRLGLEAEEAVDETLNQVLAAEKRGGHDLETCLALLELSDVEVKRELEGPRGEVRVMTVHGAKGLEAPVVILPDTTMRAKPQGPSLTPVEDGDGAVSGWLMCPSSQGEDCAATAEARAVRLRRTEDESLRLLYVALTRARDRLILMGRKTRRPKSGFEPRSWWEALSQAFADPASGARQVAEGRWRIGDDPAAAPRAAVMPAASAVPPEWARRASSPDRLAPVASPSQIGEVLRVPAPSPLALQTGLGRFRRGDLIHRLLERLPEIAPEAWLETARRLMSRERDLTEEQRQDIVAAALGVLHDPRFAPVFGPGSRAEVALAGRSPELGLTLSGRIDRLVVTPGRVLVVDYKTNRPAPRRIEDADPAYILQSASYVSILRQLYPDDRIEAALVWTDGPRLMPIPDDLIAAALAAR